MAKFLDHVGLTHYTGKLKKLLAGKQDKLIGTPGSVLSFDAQSSPIYLPHWSNPNLLDNWYFKDPINQQGKTEYTGFGITIDRWALNSEGEITLNNGIQALNDTTQLRYNFDDIQIGAPYTFTLLMTGESTTEGVWAGGVTVADNDWVTFIDSMVWYRDGNLLSVFFIVDKELAGSLELGINCTNGNTITAAKLESGDRQTLARKSTSGHWVLNDQPPNKALELAKCQRYRIRLTNNPILTGMTSLDGNSLFAAIHLPTAMRRVPTILQCTLIYAVAGGSSITSFSSVNIYGGAPNQSMFYLHFAVSGLPPATAAGICLGELDLEAQ